MYRVSAIMAALLIAGCATEPSSNQAAATPGARAASSSAQSSPAAAPPPSSASQISMGQGGRGGSFGGAKGTPAARSVYYEYDKAELKPEDRRLIEEHARFLRANPGAKIKIEGNADERGSSEYNLALGQRRADVVVRALQAGGVSTDRMEAVSWGKEKPVATGHDEKSWSQNRRSDFVYGGK